MKIFFKNQNGLAAILTIVIIGAISIIAIKFVSWQAITDLDISYLGQKEKELNTIADGCLEEALWQLSIDWNFAAPSQAVSVGSGSCVYSIEPDGQNRAVNLTAQIDDYFKSMAIEVGNSQKIEILSYNTISS